MEIDDYPKLIKWVETAPDLPGNEPPRYFHTGKKFFRDDGSVTEITSITLQLDVPGPHCNMPRVCVWHEGTLLAEFPYMAAGCIAYV